jgi:sugar phosphate isomerase/epimerase
MHRTTSVFSLTWKSPMHGSQNREQGPAICLCQANFPTLSISRFLEVASSAGADAIDLHPGLSGEATDTVVAAVAASALDVVLVSPLPDWYAQTEDGRRLPPTLPGLLAVAAQTGGCIGVPSPLFAADAEPPSAAAMGAALAAIHAQASECGVDVALEPVGRSVLRAGARGAIGDLDAARTLMRSHALPLQLVADSYCLASAGVSLDKPWSSEDVCVVQIADWAGGEGGRVLPGKGHLPLARWLAAADGSLPAVGLEVFPLDDGGDPQGFAHWLVIQTRELLAAAESELTT